MKRNIFIRMVCLLLCFSMLTPTVAAAARPQKYPPVWIQTPYGLRTNEMLYVDQFFNHDGTFSETGEALLHWLDMTPKGEEDALWEDSGYLTLEQEIYGRSGVKYSINKNVNMITGIMITGIPGAVFDWISDNDEADYEEMFPNAGEDAVVYYQTFQQIYLDYKQAVIEGIVESEMILEYVSDALGKLDEYGGELICATSTKTSAYIIANTQKKANFNAEAADLLDVRELENGNIEWRVLYKDGTVDWFSPKVVTDPCRRGEKSLVLNDKTGKKPEKVQPMIDRGLEQMSTGKGSRKNVGAKEISCQTLSNLSEGIEEADGYDNLSKQHKNSAKATREQVEESAKKQKELAAERWDNDISHIADLIGVGVDTYFYWKDYGNMTALQAGYMDALFNTSCEYYDMLTRWRNSLEVTEDLKNEQFEKILDSMNYNPPAGDDGFLGVESNSLNVISTRIAMQDALDRVRADIAVTYYETQETIKEVIAGETFILTAEERNEVMISGIEAIFGIVADEIKLAVKAAKSTIAASSTGAAGSAATTGSAAATGVVAKIGAVVAPIAWAVALSVSNSITESRLDFADSATAVTDLKLSLYALLTEEENGLLAQYANNPTHETACTIIEALKTMKIAKYYGENLVREYYLADLYKDLDIDPGSSVHTVLWNELQLNSVPKLPDIVRDKNVINFVNVVYEEDVKIQVDEETEKITQVMGVYARDPGVQLSYKSKILEPFDNYPSYKRLTMKDPQTYGTGVDFNTWLSSGTLNANNPNKRYQSHGAFLYTRNGLDLILTADELSKYSIVQANLQNMYNRYYDEDAKISNSERLNIDRLSWTWDCQQWIESFEMYSSAVDYSKHKVEHGLVPN